jgi:hypothetical protein
VIFLQLPPIYKLDILKDIKSLMPFKSVAFGGVPDFIINGRSTISVQLLKHFLHLSLSPEHFPRQWRKKKGYCACLDKEATVLPLVRFLRG